MTDSGSGAPSFDMKEIWDEDADREYTALLERDCAEHLGADRDPVAAGFATESPCVFCGANGFRSLFRQGSYRWERCTDCGLLQKRPRPHAAALERFYRLGRAIPFYEERVLRRTADAREARIFGPYLDRLEALVASAGLATGTLLDIGCSSGSFLSLAQGRRLVARYVGVEPNRAHAALARARGFAVHEALFEDAPLEPASLSVITCFTTFQFAGEPRRFLSRCASLLVPGGVLVLTGPNGWGPDVLLLAPDSPVLPGHQLQLPDPVSFARVCGIAGLGAVSVEATGQLDVQIVHGAWQRHPPERSDPRVDFLCRLFLDQGTGEPAADLQSHLRRHQLSGHLWMQARRP